VTAAATVDDTGRSPDMHGVGVLRMSIRRSVGLVALPAMLTLVVANVLGRSRGWVHEWVWAHYQYGFVTVLLGPMVAGVAGWEGARLSRSRELIATTDRTLAAVTVAWLAVATWVLVSFAAGLGLVDVMVASAGTPGLPPAIAVASSVPAAALLLLEAAAGLTVGWWMRHLVAAPFVAVSTFLLTLWLYVSGPGELVVVGGATSSLVNAAPRPAMIVWQSVWFGTATVAVLMCAAMLPGWRTGRRRWQLPAVVCLCALALVQLLRQGEVYLAETPQPQVCTGSHPTVCVAPGYTSRADDVRRVLLPYVSASRRLGIPVPDTFRQNGPRGQVTSGTFDISLLDAPGQNGPATFLAAYLSKECPIDTTPALQEAYTGLAWWLAAVVHGERAPDDSVPAVVRGPPSAAQSAWLVTAARSLSTCER
jgi:hypothetical protein